MKEVRCSDLIPGKVYADVETRNKTLLKFSRNEKGIVFFTYVSGAKSYLIDSNGEIGFNTLIMGDFRWYSK